MKKILPLLFLFTAFSSLKANVIVSSPQFDLQVGGYIFIDVNNDGVNDYLLAVGNNSNGPITIKGYNGCQVETGGDYKAIGLNNGAPVGSNSWQDSAGIYDFASGIYYFPLNTFASLGLKLSKGGQTYYGYLTIEVSGNYSVNGVMSFVMGYDNVPGQIVDAGATAAGISEVGPGNIKWYVANQTLKVSIPGNTGSEFQIYSCEGKMLVRKNITGETEEISLNGLRAGTYLFAINNGNMQFSRPFVKP